MSVEKAFEILEKVLEWRKGNTNTQIEPKIINVAIERIIKYYKDSKK